MSWIAWIIFGALVGWVANLIIGGKDRRSGCLFNMVVGVLGAALGGFLYKAITKEPWDFSFSLRSFGVAVLGSVLLLAVVSLATRRKR